MSIVLVLLGHLNGTKGFVHFDPGVGDYAHLGVLVFFVISGFLITRLLMSEYEQRSTVSLKRFYARRALRLFPASYGFILAMAALSLTGFIHLRTADLVGASIYAVNYMTHRSWQIGQLWSLSIEEQFYMIWPVAFALSVRRSSRSPVWIAGMVILLGPITRSLAWLFLRHTPYYDLELFPTIADSLAMGCMLAMVKDWLEQQSWYLKLFHPLSAVAMIASMLLISRYANYTIISVPGMSLTYAMIAILVHRSIYRHDGFVGKILNYKPVAFVGVMSYSLYLWQQPFLDRYSSAWVDAFPQNIILAVFTALASYFVLETPFLKLRKRLSSNMGTKQRRDDAVEVPIPAVS